MRPKARKTIGIVQDGLHRIVFETRWKRDQRGWRVRDGTGHHVDLGWGETAAAWVPLRDFDIEHVLALAEKVDEEKIGREIWGVPVPPGPEFATMSADLVEALAYGGFRPGEILAACGHHYAPEDLGDHYLRICQRNVDGALVAGTKSSRYPEKDVFLLGLLSKTLARLAAAAGPEGLLFP